MGVADRKAVVRVPALKIDSLMRDELDVEALSSGVAEATRWLPAGADVTFIVTHNFEETVRGGISDPELAAQYRQDRVRGGAIAYVLETDGGPTEVVIDASVVALPDVDAAAVRRLFAHESLHVAIRHREEDMTGRRARLGLERGSVRGSFAGLAGMAIEEFRVERALAQAGLPLERSYYDGLPAFVEAVRASMEAGGDAADAEGDATPFLNAMLEGFEQLMTVVAYLLGDDIGSDGARSPDLSTLPAPGWLETSYDALRNAFLDVPGAAVPILRRDLDVFADAIDDELRAWLSEIGLDIEDAPDGGWQVSYRTELIRDSSGSDD
jgi:hypothetical protein